MADITASFLLDQVDHQELLALLSLHYGTCWRVSDREIAFPATLDHHLSLEIRHGQITKVSSGQGLTNRELETLLRQVQVDLNDHQIAEYGAAILFASRPCEGSFR